MRFFFSKKGNLVSETTYDRLFISRDTISILIFPVFEVGQPEEYRIAYPYVFLLLPQTNHPHKDFLSSPSRV